MNNTITIDTHLHAKNLKRVGFSDEQVDAQLALAQAQTDFINNNLATKTNIFLIQRDIAELRKDTKHDIALVLKIIEERTKVLIWIGCIIGFIIGTPQVLKLFGF